MKIAIRLKFFTSTRIILYIITQVLVTAGVAAQVLLL